MNSLVAGKGVIVIPIIISDDSWNAPALVKSSFAFEIIWFIFSLFQLLFLFNVGSLPAGTRRPYTILLYATLSAVIYYLMIAIWTKLRDSMHYVIYDRMNIAITFFYIVTVVLQPAAALSLIHQLGSALQVARKREVIPFVSRPWKRTLDWILVGVTFVIYIAALGNNAAYVAAVREGDISTSQVSQFSRVSQGLGHTTVALVVILSLNVVFSLISLFVEARHAHWSDQAFARLRQVIAPFSIIYALEWIIFDIYFATTSSSSSSYKTQAANFARVLVEGICRIAITGGLISTMDLPEKIDKPTKDKPAKGAATLIQQPASSTPYQPPWVPPQPQQPQQSYPMRDNGDYR